MDGCIPPIHAQLIRNGDRLKNVGVCRKERERN